MDLLIRAVRKRIQELQRSGDQDEASSTDFAPLTARELDAVERRLGHRLPESVRALYGTVGNGGYGPAYGLLGLVGGMTQEEGHDALSQREMYLQPDPSDAAWAWRKGLLPLVHLGCAMYFCVDCTTAEGDVVWFEPNAHDQGAWDDTFFPLGLTFEALMRTWADGVSTLELMEVGRRG